MVTLKQILKSLTNHEERLDSLESMQFLKTKIVDLATNLTISGNASPATVVTEVPQIYGYKAIYVTLENTYNGSVSLWYVYLNPEGSTISWRCKNNSSSAVSGITIRVRILYVKEENFGGLIS